MFQAYDLMASMSLEELVDLKQRLKGLSDPYAEGAFRMVDGELRTRQQCRSKLASLANKRSNRGRQKRSLRMNKTIWYGVKDNNVQFADSKSALTEQGITETRSFAVNGDVTGLDLAGHQQQSQAQPQPAS